MRLIRRAIANEDLDSLNTWLKQGRFSHLTTSQVYQLLYCAAYYKAEDGFRWLLDQRAFPLDRLLSEEIGKIDELLSTWSDAAAGVRCRQMLEVTLRRAQSERAASELFGPALAQAPSWYRPAREKTDETPEQELDLAPLSETDGQAPSQETPSDPSPSLVRGGPRL